MVETLRAVVGAIPLGSTLIKGGILMVPIGLCSVLALAIVLERLFVLRHPRVVSPEVLRRVETCLREGDTSEALLLCRRQSSAITRILHVGIANHHKPKSEIKEVIEDAGRHEVPSLERYLGVLGTIASISPLLGLLGTVTGMIKVFNVIAVRGVGHPGALAGGISEALITTAAGLAVAIPSLVFYNYFVTKADGLIIEMEKASLRMLDILKRD
ncbi:MAG: MotA/TolQ/ExbB proton channel family protein [Candidatus Tectimicrobiota bacterium]